MKPKSQAEGKAMRVSDGVVGIGLSILRVGLAIGLIYNAVRAAQARWKKRMKP